MVGGWANRWFGDVYCLKVGEVVGPPYSIDSISQLGTHHRWIEINTKGIGFSSSGQATIRFPP